MKKISHSIRKVSSISLLLAIMFVFVTSCNQEENVQPQQEEDLPDLVTALESFDEEVEYSELSGQDARRGPKERKWKKKWRKKPTFFTLAAALKYTGLFVPVVQNKLTIFAPTDEAFHDIGINFWNVWRFDKEVLTNIILYHAAEGFIYSNQLPECSVDMLNGSTIGFKFMEGKVFINDASEDFAQVIATDKRALNSVFHIIDKVLSPPDMTIAEIAVGNSDFSTLVSLLIAADLVDAVADPEANLTVFAPTNDAFTDLLAAVAPFDLLGYFEEYPDELTKVLLHHVAGGSAFSFCLSDGQEIPTLNGEVTALGNPVSQIESSSGNAVGLIGGLLDIHANNGVIHAIDAVLLPENLDLTKPVPAP